MKKHGFVLVGVVALAVLFAACNNQSGGGLPPPVKPATKNPYIDSLWATDHYLDTATGFKWIQNYIDFMADSGQAKPRQLFVQQQLHRNRQFYKEEQNLPYSESFNALAIYQILELKGVTGTRMHYGLDDEGRFRLLLTGIDTDGNLLFVTRTDNNQKAQIGRIAPNPGQAVFIEMGLDP